MKRKRAWVKYVRLILFVICIFLSSSRSAYVGVAIYGICGCCKRLKSKKTTKKSLFYGLVTVCLGVIVFVCVWKNSESTVTRLLASLNWETFLDGAGRTSSAINYFKWLVSTKGSLIYILFGSYGMEHSGGGYEMTYVCVFENGGIVGLCLFLYPIIKILSEKINRNDVNRDIAYGLKVGCIVYLLAANVEGGFWTLPTAINLWIILGLYTAAVQLKKGHYTEIKEENSL